MRILASKENIDRALMALYNMRISAYRESLARGHGPPAIPLRPWAVDQSVEALQDMFRWAPRSPP